MIETGVGAQACHQSLSWIESHLQFDLIIASGFAGALTPDLKVGDVVIPEAILTEDNYIDTHWPEQRQGKLLTMDRMIASKSEKRHLYEMHHASAVDMESATIAKFCREHKIRFGCVRAISDDAETELSPTILKLLSGAKPSLCRILSVALLRPWLWPELGRLAKSTRIAADQLKTKLLELCDCS